MSLMIAVKSCIPHMQRGDHQVIRATWGKDARALGIDVRFFVGAPTNTHVGLQQDEICLKSPDDYDSLPYKTRAICRWFGGKITTNLFLCDTDTFLIPRLMLKSGYEKYDYAGRFNGNIDKVFSYDAVNRAGLTDHHPKCYPWASGGFGYFLSKHACGEISDAMPTTWAEDLWVGQILGPLATIGKCDIGDLTHAGFANHFPSSQYKQGYEPSLRWMEQQYEQQ